jgi:hypothetical protein
MRTRVCQSALDLLLVQYPYRLLELNELALLELSTGIR